MTQQEKERYQATDTLRTALETLKNQKFVLDCGHHVTFNHFLGNDVTIRNGKKLTITCSQCGY